MEKEIIQKKSFSAGYSEWKNEIIEQIHYRQLHTVLNVNAETLQNYWEIGKQILQAQEEKGWGSHVIKQLSIDLEAEFGKCNGYSERNLRSMKIFAQEYPDFPILQVPLAELPEDASIWQAPLAKLNSKPEILQVPLTQITWYHHISLITKVKNIRERAFYISETAHNGWSRDIMIMQVDSNLYERSGKTINNFKQTLPAEQSDLAKAVFKDPYNFGFIEMSERQNELDIEKQLITRINDFLIEMGKGFAYVGRQYHLVVDGDDYYIDLLMYHTRLHCYVVIELKAVEFIPEFVSKLNFYISAVDDIVKMPEDKPTIGLLLCRTKSKVKAEYALKGITQPLGIASYETERILREVKSSLPSIEEIEKELEEEDKK